MAITENVNGKFITDKQEVADKFNEYFCKHWTYLGQQKSTSYYNKSNCISEMELQRFIFSVSHDPEKIINTVKNMISKKVQATTQFQLIYCSQLYLLLLGHCQC